MLLRSKVHECSRWCRGDKLRHLAGVLRSSEMYCGLGRDGVHGLSKLILLLPEKRYGGSSRVDTQKGMASL